MTSQKLFQWTSLLLAGASVFTASQAQAAFTFSRIASTDPSSVGPSYSQVYRGLGTSGHLSAWGPAFNLAADANYQAGRGIALSDRGGRVAYHARTVNGDAIYTNTGGRGINARQLIAQVGTQIGPDTIVGFGPGIAISANWNVAFVAKMSDGSQRIYTRQSSTAPLELIASSANGYTFAPGLSINNKGEVAFTAKSNGVVNVFKGDPGGITQISQCGANQCLFQAPSINHRGWVSFSMTDGIYAGNGAAVSQVITNPTFVAGAYREANINDNDMISAFIGVLPTIAIGGPAGQAIFTGDGTDGSVVASNYCPPGQAHACHFDPTSSSFINMGTSSINDRNDNIVAFMANQTNPRDDRYKKGIFIGDDPLKDKVIGIGDALDGSTVTDLAMDRGSLNNDNEITFWAKLANGFEGIFRANSFADSQFNPWLPNCPVQQINQMNFCGVTSGRWFDPPTAYGFNYEMDSDSLFTSILDLPVDFDNPFTVSVGDKVLGQFASGDEINFSHYADLLGDLLLEGLDGGMGVKNFTVRTGDTIDPTNPMALPIKLAFNTETADFTLRPLDPEYDSADVPEPSTLFGLVGVGAVLLRLRQRRPSRNS